MAVAFDAAVESVRTGTSDPHTWTHTPSGTPRAIVVSIVHGTSSTDHVNTVTYGGVSMSEVIRASDTATEPGDAQLWFLGSGIPTGNQTVSVDLTSATTDDIHFVSMSFTAAADCAVVDSDEVNENAAAPSVTLQYGGLYSIAVAALYGGGASPASFTPNGNCETVHDHDLGAFYSEVIRQTTPGTSDFAIGGTASTDDVAYVALALSDGMAPITGFGTTAELGTPTVVTANTTQDVLIRVGATAVVTAPEFTEASNPDHTETPDGFGTTAGLGTPVVAVTVAPEGYGTTSSLGTPLETVTALPTGYGTTSGLGTPALQADSTVEPSGQEATSALGEPTADAVTLVEPTGLEATAGLGTPSLTADSVVAPSGFEGTSELGTPSAFGGASVSPDGFGTTADLGTPGVTADSVVAPAGQEVMAELGTPAVDAGAVTEPSGLEVTASLGTPAVVNDSTVTPDGFGLTADLGSPTVDDGAAPEAPPAPSGSPIPTRWQRRPIRWSAVPEDPAAPKQDTTVVVSGFAMQARVGTTWQVADAAVVPLGLGTQAGLGAPAVTGMHNPTDEQVVEWLLAALAESV